jgi:hypothetical protein
MCVSSERSRSALNKEKPTCFEPLSPNGDASRRHKDTEKKEALRAERKTEPREVCSRSAGYKESKISH